MSSVDPKLARAVERFDLAARLVEISAACERWEAAGPEEREEIGESPNYLLADVTDDHLVTLLRLASMASVVGPRLGVEALEIAKRSRLAAQLITTEVLGRMGQRDPDGRF